MKNLFNLTLSTVALAAVVVFGSCSTDDGDVAGVVTFAPSGSVDGADVLTSYADDVVITRYENLATLAGKLYAEVQKLTGGADEAAQIKVAAEAWVATRLAWERTEAYLFGPVDLYKIDPGIDSWPLALSSLADAIKGYTSGSYTDYNIKNDNGELKGFHTVEFLLFEDGAAKSVLTDFNNTAITASDYGLDVLTGAEVQTFLEAIAKELYYNTARLVAEWDSVDNDVVEAANAAGLDVLTNNGGGYYDDFTTAGDDESSYSSLSDALSVILESAAGIADEVGAVKINDPYVSKNVLDVESWFSWNSVYDFTDNIIGIKEAYYGMLFVGLSTDYASSAFASASAASSSISAYVASGSADLDSSVKDAIENAIAKVSSLPYPFRNYLDDAAEAATIEAAMEACEELLEALETAQMAVNDGYYIE
ncbi:MAG: imelysin family protein [Rikenellaceae bacterium]